MSAGFTLDQANTYRTRVAAALAEAGYPDARVLTGPAKGGGYSVSVLSTIEDLRPVPHAVAKRAFEVCRPRSDASPPVREPQQ